MMPLPIAHWIEAYVDEQNARQRRHGSPRRFGSSWLDQVPMHDKGRLRQVASLLWVAAEGPRIIHQETYVPMFKR